MGHQAFTYTNTKTGAEVTISFVYSPESFPGDCGTKAISYLRVRSNVPETASNYPTKKEVKAMLLWVIKPMLLSQQMAYRNSYKKVFFSGKEGSEIIRHTKLMGCQHIKAKSSHGGHPFMYALKTFHYGDNKDIPKINWGVWKCPDREAPEYK